MVDWEQVIAQVAAVVLGIIVWTIAIIALIQVARIYAGHITEHF